MPSCYCDGRCHDTGVCPVIGDLRGARPAHRSINTRLEPELTEKRVRDIAREEAQQILRESLTRSIRRLPERAGHI